MADLDRVVAEVAAALERARIGYMVIGGVAVAVWGSARATVDIDIAAAVDRHDAMPLLTALKDQIGELPTDIETFAAETGVLPFRHRSGIRIDLGLSTHPYVLSAIARAVSVDVHGVEVKFCTAEDLILHKLIADRDRDRGDVVDLIRLRGNDLDRGYLDP
ncbi:MAG TPA: nucleotidyl transferase AbiEii/AbiGii toxin family protein, partial [Thermoanaerobaculia bacterium]|nr:nucleotidyl transferase AbiEii/AbiGii toxin family protein [Thermoanaerobaculia bacterium]